MNDPFRHLSIDYLVGGFTRCPPDWSVTQGTYGYGKLYLYAGGTSRLTITGDHYAPQAGELYFIPPDTAHTYSHQLSDPVVQYWCHLDISAGHGQRIVHTADTACSHPPYRETMDLFRALIAPPRGVIGPYCRRVRAQELFAVHLRSISRPEQLLSVAADRRSRVAGVIEERYHTPLTVPHLARVAHMHPRAFITWFHRTFGLPPVRYVNAKRLSEALRILSDEIDLPVREVAERVGFRDYRYFARLFRRRYGIAPSEYRAGHGTIKAR